MWYLGRLAKPAVAVAGAGRRPSHDVLHRGRAGPRRRQRQAVEEKNMSSAQELTCMLLHLDTRSVLRCPHAQTVIFLRRSCQLNVGSSNDLRTSMAHGKKTSLQPTHPSTILCSPEGFAISFVDAHARSVVSRRQHPSHLGRVLREAGGPAQASKCAFLNAS